ncbi:MAG TPA: RNB domain-containing ribonuclease [Solirubrobacteraceae bacterium]|nr:RNB domain-containing ribonuclease [Solirubrobacteraceae bacterium]
MALLERQGRFLTAERLFPAREEDRLPGRRGASSRSVVGPARGAGGGGGGGARAGDIVLVRATRGGRGSGLQVVRRIGRPDSARDVIEALMLDRGLRRGFPDGLEQDARTAAGAASRSPGERRDLRGLATFTIDPASARDFDDAISAETLADGACRVWVHIADVCAHVEEGGALDREARHRATSVYVPGTVEPMLPHALSSEACSLMPDVDRLAVTVELELDHGKVRRSAFYRSLVRSDVRLDYEGVDRIFAGEGRAREPWAEPLACARAAAAALAGVRERAGALKVESEEPQFSFDERGEPVAIEPREQTESHRLIENLMIAANEAVAARLAAAGSPCLYRVHERPEPERIVRLVDQLASLEVPTPPVPEPMSPSQAAELVGEVSQAVERYTRNVGHGRIALGSLVLRSLRQAYYSPRNIGHAGLRSSTYCHFTSPIRRYPDIVCHRSLLSTLGEREQAPRASELGELGEWTSERERGAATIERDADDVARCFLLERLLRREGDGRVFEGEVVGLISAGAFVAFSPDPQPARELPFEGMLPVRVLAAAAARRDRPAQGPAGPGRGRGASARAGGRGGQARNSGRDWWELNEQGTILQGERSGSSLRLGQPLRVRVERVEAIRGRVDLAPAG